jgi:hypothetical protein
MASQNASDTIPRVVASPLSITPRLGLIPIPNMTVSSIIASTGSGVVPLTAAQLLGGFILCDCQDAQSASSPTAAALCEAIPGPSGSSQNTGACGFEFAIRNTGDSTLTVTAGAGATTSGTMTVLTTETKRFLVVVTNSALGSEAYTVYAGVHSTF